MTAVKRVLVLLGFMAALCFGGCGYKQTGPGLSSANSNATIDRPDARTADYNLIDQNGKNVRLYSDLLKDRVVVMTFFFTTCTTVCDAQGKHFIELQTALGDRMGNDVDLVSISKDPKNDTLEVLKKWSEKYQVGKGWSLLTGDWEEVKKVFVAFTGEGPNVLDHAPLILIGNTSKHKWLRLNGLTPVDEILRDIEKLK